MLDESGSSRSMVSITVDQLNELIDSMHDCCQAVIDANENQIPY